MNEPKTFRIDRHIPLPPRQGRKPAEMWTAWPFAQMQAGVDSFFIEATDPLSQSVSAAAASFTRINPEYRFATRWRRDDEIEHKPGIRVWRIK